MHNWIVQTGRNGGAWKYHCVQEVKFSHKSEIAKPNYYKVTFDDKITTEILPTERGVRIDLFDPEISVLHEKQVNHKFGLGDKPNKKMGPE